MKTSSRSYGSMGSFTSWTRLSDGKVTDVATASHPLGQDVFEVVVDTNQKPRNRLKVNDQYFFRRKWTHVAGSSDSYTGDTHIYTSGYLRDGIPVSVAESVPGYSGPNGEAHLRATNRFYDTLRSSDLNLATSLAEGKQTVVMVRDALRSVARWREEAFSALIGLAKPLRKGSSGASNAWLQYTYGWKPLMQDVYGLATFSRSILYERWVEATGRHIESYPERYDSGGWTASIQHTVERRTKIARRLRVDSAYLADLTRLTSLNPLAIAWELTPYSFVADWFIDIGGYLAQLEAAAGAGYTCVDGYTTHGIRQTAFIGWHSATAGGTSTSQFTSKRRFRELQMPAVIVPRLKVDLGWRRIVSAGALVRQRF